MLPTEQFAFRRPAACRVLSVGLLALFALLFGARAAQASVGLLLEMPYGRLGAFNPTGHAALYFDHICATTPLQLRPCAPGELGVVISRYNGIGNFDWVAVPLIPYLYGVQTAAEIPGFMDRLTALRMRDLYRREHLEPVAPDTPEGGMPQGNWYELVGSAFDRTIYGFQVSTTAEQDGELINYFNDRPNVTRYSGAFRNCADFTRTVLNRLYPGAIRRNYVADLGLTTPKSVARGLAHYARKHPEVDFRMFRVPQLRGSIPRSMSIQGVTGSLLTRYAVPMTILSPHITAVVLVAYVGRGRFGVPKGAPVLDVADLESAARNEPAPQEGGAGVREAESTGLTAGTAEGFGGTSDSLLRSTGDESVPRLFLSGFDCGMCTAMPILP